MLFKHFLFLIYCLQVFFSFGGYMHIDGLCKESCKGHHNWISSYMSIFGHLRKHTIVSIACNTNLLFAWSKIILVASMLYPLCDMEIYQFALFYSVDNRECQVSFSRNLWYLSGQKPMNLLYLSDSNILFRAQFRYLQATIHINNEDCQ